MLFFLVVLAVSAVWFAHGPPPGEGGLTWPRHRRRRRRTRRAGDRPRSAGRPPDEAVQPHLRRRADRVRAALAGAAGLGAWTPRSSRTRRPRTPTWLIENPTLRRRSAGRCSDTATSCNWYAASFITSTLTAVGTVLTASLAAFALSRHAVPVPQAGVLVDPGRHHDPRPGADRAAVPGVGRARPAEHVLGGDPAADPDRDRGVHLQAVLRRAAAATSRRRPGSTAPASSASTGRSSCRWPVRRSPAVAIFTLRLARGTTCCGRCWC